MLRPKPKTDDIRTESSPTDSSHVSKVSALPAALLLLCLYAILHAVALMFLGHSFDPNDNARIANLRQRTSSTIRCTAGGTACYARGYTALLSGDIKTTLAAYTAAVEQAPQRGEYYFALGNALMRSGRYSDGLLQLESAIRSGFGTWQALHNAGLALAILGNAKASIIYLRQAFAQKHDSSKLAYNLALAEKAAGNHSQALFFMGRAAVLAPNDASITRALLLLKHNEPRHTPTRSIEQLPKGPASDLHFAFLHFQERASGDKAIKLLDSGTPPLDVGHALSTSESGVRFGEANPAANAEIRETVQILVKNLAVGARTPLISDAEGYHIFVRLPAPVQSSTDQSEKPGGE